MSIKVEVGKGIEKRAKKIYVCECFSQLRRGEGL